MYVDYNSTTNYKPDVPKVSCVGGDNVRKLSIILCIRHPFHLKMFISLHYIQ